METSSKSHPTELRIRLAIAVGFIRNQGDAWSWTLDQLRHALDQITAPEITPEVELADLKAVMAAIGRRLGEMHAILARETSDPAFGPQTADAEDAARWGKKVEGRLVKALALIADQAAGGAIKTASVRPLFWIGARH